MGSLNFLKKTTKRSSSRIKNFLHILITVWLYHNTFYNNAYHNNYFFMPNFHDAMDKPWWLCRKDMSEGQKWYQKSKLRLQPNRKIIFWFVLAIKYEEKSLLGWKYLSKVKDWKQTNCHSDASFCHKIAFGTTWNQAISQKDQIWCTITFLHENATFIETFAMGFIKKLEFQDSTAMKAYFATDR